MNDKVVLITGSSGGIGKETALHFASRGAKVVVTGRREDVLSEVAEQCQQVSPNNYKPLVVVADLGIDDDVRKLVQKTIETYGKLDVLVNNAGYGAFTAIDDPNLLEVYRNMTDTNVRVPLFLTQLCAPYLEEAKGCIVNVSSIAGIRPYEKWTVYCMAKAALDMMTNCLAIELGHKGIRVNSVNPAYVKTKFQTQMGMSEEQNLAFRELQASKYPLGRVGEPSDVAKAIVFLASDDASWISGTICNLDGGGRYV